MKYIALLRGINVSGQKKIKMADLKVLVSSIDKIQNVQTYIQSGNLIFESEIDDLNKISKKISSYIYKEYKFEVVVIVKNQYQWSQIVTTNPFLKDSSIDTKCLCVTFLSVKPRTENILNLKNVDFTPDMFIIDDQIIFSCFANGIGKSKMNNNVYENKLKTNATTRNWNTMIKLNNLCNLDET